MRTENLFKAIGGIHEELLEKSECVSKPMRKILLPLAACLGIVLLAITLLIWIPRGGQSTPGTNLPPPANGNWTLNFATKVNIQTQTIALPVCFRDEMDSEELEMVLPANHPDWLTATGWCAFGKDKDPLYIYL